MSNDAYEWFLRNTPIDRSDPTVQKIISRYAAQGRPTPSDTDIAHVLWRILHESHHVTDTRGDRLHEWHGRSIEGAMPDPATPPPSPPPPTPSPVHGMQHALDTGRARSIGYGEPWFSNSRLIPDYTDAEVRAWAAHPDLEGVTHHWVSLSTGTRPEMNETPFDCRPHWGHVIDRLELINALGIQPYCELGTQEFMRQRLDKDIGRYEDYCEDIAARLGSAGVCKLIFPFREMLEQEAWPAGTSGADRVRRGNRVLKAIQIGLAGSGIKIGIHLRSYEAPPTGLMAGITAPYWLAQGRFRDDVTTPYTGDDDQHITRIWPNKAAWLEYWAKNRIALKPDLRVISQEWDIPPYNTGHWGPVSQTKEQALERGRFILTHAPSVIADFSGGATR